MKVLIISHNPLSTYQSMGKTMLSLFSEFDKEELCQLYIYPTAPNVDKCTSYLRVSDLDALKGIFKFNVSSDRMAPIKEDVQETKYIIYGNDKNRSHFRELARDLVWKISPWFNSEMKKWLYEEKPTHIFVAPGRGKFLYNIAINISKELNIPIITYICDDYYNLKKEKSILGLIWQKTLKNKIKELINKSACVITICDAMSELYKNEFNCNTVTIMTGSSNKIEFDAKNNNCISSITYMGNVSLNRYKSIVEIANALEELSKNEEKCFLDVYTGESNEEIENAFSKCSMLRLHDFVMGDEYTRTFNNAEAFLHVEAFDQKSIDRVKHSVSTKIADILASGKPVFVYGPYSVASIQHLLKNDCAFVANDKNNLVKELKYFINDSNSRRQKIKNAIITAEKYHNKSVNSKTMRKIFESAPSSKELIR